MQIGIIAGYALSTAKSRYHKVKKKKVCISNSVHVNIVSGFNTQSVKEANKMLLKESLTTLNSKKVLFENENYIPRKESRCWNKMP